MSTITLASHPTVASHPAVASHPVRSDPGDAPTLVPGSIVAPVPASFVADHLDRLADLTGRRVSVSPALVGELVALLVAATSPVGPGGSVTPDLDAPLIVHQRTAGRLAARLAGRAITLDHHSTDRLDAIWGVLDPGSAWSAGPDRDPSINLTPTVRARRRSMAS